MVATNLILEGKGAPTPLLTNAGFKYVLKIGRQNIPRRSSPIRLGQAEAPGAAAGDLRGRGRIGRRQQRNRTA
jgi:N-methylhydantoinase A